MHSNRESARLIYSGESLASTMCTLSFEALPSVASISSSRALVLFAVGPEGALWSEPSELRGACLLHHGARAPQFAPEGRASALGIEMGHGYASRALGHPGAA